MAFLNDINKCISSIAELKGAAKNYLEEKKTNTKVQIITNGQYLLYDFENIKQPLFPFFAKTKEVEGLNAIADNVLFTTDDRNNLWVFVIELKQNKGQPNKQINATKQFTSYILESVNRVCKTDYKVHIRGLAYSKMNRPKTKLKRIYDNNENAYITGDTLKLSNYLLS